MTVNKNDPSSVIYLPDFSKEVSIFGRTHPSTQPMPHLSTIPPTSTPSLCRGCRSRTLLSIKADLATGLFGGLLAEGRGGQVQALEYGPETAGVHQLLRLGRLALI